MLTKQFFYSIVFCALLYSSPALAVLQLMAHSMMDPDFQITNEDKIVWNEKFIEVYLDTLDDTGEDSFNQTRNKWSYLTLKSELTNAFAGIQLSSSIFTADSRVFRTEPFSLLPDSYADFTKGGFFTVTADCILTIEADYGFIYEATLDTEEYEGHIYAFSELVLDNFDDTLDCATDFEEIDIQLSQGHIEENKLIGKLICSIAFNAGDTGYIGIRGGTDAYFSELPEPSMICLFGFGSLILFKKQDKI